MSKKCTSGSTTGTRRGEEIMTGLNVGSKVHVRYATGTEMSRSCPGQTVSKRAHDGLGQSEDLQPFINSNAGSCLHIVVSPVDKLLVRPNGPVQTHLVNQQASVDGPLE